MLRHREYRPGFRMADRVGSSDRWRHRARLTGLSSDFGFCLVGKRGASRPGKPILHQAYTLTPRHQNHAGVRSTRHPLT